MSKTQKVLKVIGVLLVIWFVLATAFYTGRYTVSTSNNPQLPTNTQPDIYSLWQDSNNERTAHGLPALSLDPKLTASATAKCADMVRLDDWNHDLKDGTTPNDYIKAQFGDVHYVYGENISAGYHGSSPAEEAQLVTNGWIGSPGHEANLVNPHYTAVGYAVCQLPSYPNTVVQEFIGL